MTKKLIALAGFYCLILSAVAQTLSVQTPRTTLLLSAPQGEKAKIIYYGSRLEGCDLETAARIELAQDAYPVYGMNCPVEAALSVQHPDGNCSLDLVVENATQREGAGCTITTIELKDKLYPFHVSLVYKAWQDADVIEMWSEISHQEKKPVRLVQYASAYLPVRRGQVWVSHLSGSWANEGQLTQEPLTPGMLVIKNKDGVRNSHTDHAEIMLSLDGQPQENSGRTIGAALCYGGNFKLRLETHDDEFHHLFAGINEDNSAYLLEKGETFVTPALALTFSAEGLSGSSRNFHRWARSHKLANADVERKILLNSWEGVYFDINQEGMEQMMSDIASMGGELFVMDDGWFGGKYKRKTDNAALGDWVVDEEKLPKGIQGLIDAAHQRGIKFGIWIEPEMANTTSELFEKHPDWVIQAPGRDLVLGRGGTQVVLDLANPAVQDFIFQIVDDLMTNYPAIDYIKWDANMAIMNHGSHYLPAQKQSHLHIAYHRGFEQICQRIRAKYPKLTIQACASGGGRANYGILPYFDEFWVSDNTDALQRVYMQWGTSYFFPAIAMASHISAAPNHQTSRVIPLKYRIDVAMSGRLGMEIQPKNMTDQEKELCRKAIAQYKQIRPIVQQGNIYRLLSPYDKQGAASLMYVSDSKDRAVFYWWKTEQFVNQHLARIPMAGLSADKRYRITELNRIDPEALSFEGATFTGAYLMANGLELPYAHKLPYHYDYASRVLLIEEVK